jgi:hypothetical protein
MDATTIGIHPQSLAISSPKLRHYQAGYEANGGGFNNAPGSLRTLELVEGRGEIKASDNQFDAG